MKTRTFVAVAASVALVVPAAAVAKVVPAKHPAQTAKRVAKPKPVVVPRVLCICVTGVVMPVETEAQIEAQVDHDLIAHGLDPIYGTTTTTEAADTTTSSG